jgi:bacterioferritin
MNQGFAVAEAVDVAHIIAELGVAYRMELETVMNYLANSTNLDGVRAQEIKDSLRKDVKGELEHAEKLAKRIHVLGGQAPGSLAMQFDQRMLQPPRDQTDVVGVIKGVIQAEQGAVDQYNKIIRMCEGADYATQDLCIQLLADEEEHRREFEGFLTEYRK